MDAWSIYIDIEGFGGAYPNGNAALNALRELMRGIHRIGERIYPEAGRRLFAHQVGDGFLIKPDFPEESLERAVAIAVFLMRYVSGTGFYCRAAIAEGDLADIVSCYPGEVLNKATDSTRSTVSLGEGLMTIYPVMGTSLINAVFLDKRAPKGPLLSIAPHLGDRLSESRPYLRSEARTLQVDWLHWSTPVLAELVSGTGLSVPSASALEANMSRYLAESDLPEEWKNSCRQFFGVEANNN